MVWIEGRKKKYRESRRACCLSCHRWYLTKFLNPPTLPFCVSKLCFSVCACMCLHHFLGICQPVSLSEPEGWLELAVYLSYYRAFDFSGEAKWDSRCKESCKVMKMWVHAMWLLAKRQHSLPNCCSLFLSLCLKSSCLARVHSLTWERGMVPSVQVTSSTQIKITSCFSRLTVDIHSEKAFVHERWPFQLSTNTDSCFVI